MDKRFFLHPATSIADHLVNGPRIISSAQGVHVTDRSGRRMLDGASGLWCVNVGYGRTEIADAIAAQAHDLAFYHTFNGASHEPVIRLAEKVMSLMPDNMSKVSFGLSGSDANDTNIKLVWYINNLLGRPEKKKIIARNRAYHGVGLGSGSLTGLPIYQEYFDLPLPGFLHTHSVDQYREKPEEMTEAEYSTFLATELEQLILREGPDTVGAFIAEPVMGTGGVLVPPEGYFPAIQAVLDRHDVLLIVDEVICGFGRVGRWSGSERFGIRPDFITLGKGISSGYQPISGSVISERVWNVLEETASKVASFGHGYTYSAHPVCAAAALANINIIEREDLGGNADRVGNYMKAKLVQTFGDHPLVGDIRGVGMMLGIELVADRTTKTSLDPVLGAAGRVMKRGYEEGIMVRALPHRDVVAMSPPLCCSEADVDELVAGLERAFAFVTEELHREGALRASTRT
ncbi:MAG: aminotransferase [Phycisphaeraceae bacterium]